MDLLSGEDAFSVVDTVSVRHNLERWRNLFPMVRPFFAVKCNPQKSILEALLDADKGQNSEEVIGFDCASAEEIRLALETGASAAQIIYAHPVKHPEDLRFALERGVFCMTLDSVPELEKIKEVAEAVVPEALAALQLVLRLRVPDNQALCPLGRKFGATFLEGKAMESDTDVRRILEVGAREGLPICGLSFHVGSGCLDPTNYDRAIDIAYKVALYMEERGLPRLSLLDVGGGFPGGDGKETMVKHTGEDAGPSAKDVATVLNASLARTFFATHPDVKVIAEPGRFFVAGCQIICVEVFEVRSRPNSGRENDRIDADVFISEGVHGAFKDAALIQESFRPRVIPGVGPSREREGESLQVVCIRGPSGQPNDIICPRVLLPRIESGQWLAFDRAGAYTTSIASKSLSALRQNSMVYVGLES